MIFTNYLDRGVNGVRVVRESRADFLLGFFAVSHWPLAFSEIKEFREFSEIYSP